MFSTWVRVSGMAIGTQLGFAIAGLASTLASAVADTGPDNWLGVSQLTAVLCLINVAAVALRERRTESPLPDRRQARHSEGDVSGGRSEGGG
ncbi:hypothetical protein [Nonomuraea sp. NPDC049750]|uniref:hypothetical protein n=1 Tax=Nonomuraea sp. NPDC049750 TaxID=3154738 RepID=UPI0033E72140